MDDIARYTKQKITKPTVLVVEPNPYHGEILPGITHLLQDVGYAVHVLMRNEVVAEQPFALMPKVETPVVFAGSAKGMKTMLENPITNSYETVLLSSSAYWETDKNFSSYIQFLGFVPRGKYGCLFLEHNLSKLSDDDCKFFYEQGRVCTLLEYPFQGGTSPMLNPHYFGPVRIKHAQKQKKEIVVMGASSRDAKNLKKLYQAIRELSDQYVFNVTIVGGSPTIPADIGGHVKATGRVDFKQYYSLIENADYLLTVIDNKLPDQKKYTSGTTSGTVQSSLGFCKPMIIAKEHAAVYGFDEKTAIIYDDMNIGLGLKQALGMAPTRYQKLVTSLQEKAKDIEQTSLSTLKEMIDRIKSKNPEDIATVDHASLIVGAKSKAVQALTAKATALEDELLRHKDWLNMLDVQVEEQDKQFRALHVRPEDDNLWLDRQLLNALKSTSPTKRIARIPLRAYKRYRNIKHQQSFDKQVALLKSSPFFDEDFYKANNPDVANAPIDPVVHYVLHGYKENRNPSALFDQAYYLARNADVRAMQLNPLIHYLMFGSDEGRAPRLNLSEDIEDKRPAIAFQLDVFDRGGLEEVVLMLACDAEINKAFRVYIFVSGESGGYLAELAQSRGVQVLFLNWDKSYLEYLVQRLDIKLCNLHYSIFGVATYKHLNTRLVYTIHNNYIWADSDFIQTRGNAYRNIDRFIAVSDQVGNFFSKKFGIDPSKISTVNNGLNLTHAATTLPQKRANYGLGKQDFVFVNVGSFTANKFHTIMVAAMSQVVKKHPSAKLLLIGNIIDHEYFKTVKRMIVKYEVGDSIKIIDFVPKGQLLGLLKIADCFVMPSLTEGFSIASLEAMYHQLPLILTDVGGARHTIANEDIGLVIENAYPDVLELTNDKIAKLYVDDSNLHNLQQLVVAMENMIENKVRWKQKALTGKSKVETQFQDTHVAAGYIAQFGETLRAPDVPFFANLEHVLSNLSMTFVAPYPTDERVTEGWMSRIRAIDAIIGNVPKVYVNITPGDERPLLIKHDIMGWEVTIGRQAVAYSKLFSLLVKHSDAVYAHTLHLGEHVLPWLDSKKIIVDFHGITPEEEVMLGRAYLRERYEAVEQLVLSHAKACVMVTHAMAAHYKRKYPNLRPKKIITLPIVEDLEIYYKKIVSHGFEKYQTVYSGGTQTWQNVEAMMSATKQCAAYAKTTFLSHDWEHLMALGAEQGLPSDTVYKFCAKPELSIKYRDYDFGFVLRDDTPVNRVACPTKLYEYMVCGIIPIVRTPDLGDFNEFGYRYVREQDYLKNKLPNEAEMRVMLKANYAAVKKMKYTFKDGSNKLKKEVS